MLIYEQDGTGALKRFLERTGYMRDNEFAAAFEALLNSIPQKREEFQTLRRIALALLGDRVQVPQLEIDFSAGAEEGEEDAEEEEDA